MNYRVTCLTPTLVGGGQRLAPIDYMVWKDQVNVLDQQRIFKLLSKGPRLEGYLNQLRKADKLDFASWGGFAQNYADRRIPFEHPSMTVYWERARGDSLFIPTFNSGLNGPYLPGSAVKGALRTGLVFVRWTPGLIRDVASRLQGDRVPRRPADPAEEHAVGAQTRAFLASDSLTVPASHFKIYLLRIATLRSKGHDSFELGWKTPGGTVDGRRPEDATPLFAEMAPPATKFEGTWRERAYFQHPEIARAMNWREAPQRQKLLEAANRYAGDLLDIQRNYATRAGLQALSATVGQLERELEQARSSENACLLPLGWGAGLTGKVAFLDAANESYRQILRQVPFYSKPIASGMPFPKTRRILFLGNQPASLPGWTRFEIVE